MKVEVSGVVDLNRALSGLSSRIKDRVVKRFSQKVFDEAEEGADEHTITGAMIRSLTLKKQSQDTYKIGHNLQHAPHASFVHWGTKPPGYKGDPYLTDAVRTTKSKLADIIKNVSTE